MARKARTDRSSVAGQTVSVRLTESEVEMLDAFLAKKNAMLKQQGLPPLVTRGVYLRTLVLRDLENQQASVDTETATSTPPSLAILPPKKRPDNVKPTVWDRLMADDIIPDDEVGDSEKKGPSPSRK